MNLGLFGCRTHRYFDLVLAGRIDRLLTDRTRRFHRVGPVTRVSGAFGVAAIASTAPAAPTTASVAITVFAMLAVRGSGLATFRRLSRHGGRLDIAVDFARFIAVMLAG
jgi:hypothetical protein